ISYHTVCFALAEKIYCHRSHYGRVYTILTCRASAALHVSENSSPGLHAGCCLDSLRHVNGITDSLSINDNIILLSALLALHDILDDCVFIEIMLLRHQDTLSAVRDTAPESKVSCVTSHTSMMLQRSCDVEVSRTLSIASITVLTAV